MTAPLLSLLAIPLAAVAAAQDMPPQQQNALVRKYCASGHTDAARNGGFSLQHLFQGETVVFPVDTLDQQARRELARCFRVE